MVDLENKVARLSDAAHLALGWMVAKEGLDNSAVYFLALALKESGSDSRYINEILKRYTRSFHLLEGCNDSKNR